LIGAKGFVVRRGKEAPVIAKAEHGSRGANPGYALTNLRGLVQSRVPAAIFVWNTTRNPKAPRLHLSINLIGLFRGNPHPKLTTQISKTKGQPEPTIGALQREEALRFPEMRKSG
jgi:hypothetical protein